NATLIQDPDGNETTNQYDARSRLILTVTDPAGQTTQGLHHTEYAYDGLDRKIRETKFDDLDHLTAGPGGNWAQQTLYTYTPSGQLASETNGLGEVTVYTYDSRNRLSTKQEQGNVNLAPSQYFYDADSNLIREIDPRGIVLEHQYDLLNRSVG